MNQESFMAMAMHELRKVESSGRELLYTLGNIQILLNEFELGIADCNISDSCNQTLTTISMLIDRCQKEAKRIV